MVLIPDDTGCGDMVTGNNVILVLVLVAQGKWDFD
tara:strand:+ start:196 stop:300 length:105 start_codon:yes stop_codon:yes gene_type:complete